MKIYAQKNGSLNETDCIELAKLLFKAGYAVIQSKEVVNKKNTRVVEFWVPKAKECD